MKIGSICSSILPLWGTGSGTGQSIEIQCTGGIMNNIWNGALLGNIYKHRDYAHDTFLEHEIDNGDAFWLGPGEDVDDDFLDLPGDDIDPEDVDEDYDEDNEEDEDDEAQFYIRNAKKAEPHYLSRDPVTGEVFEEPRPYYLLILELDVWYGKKKYEYYIPAASNGGVPGKQAVSNELDKYNQRKRSI
jgi:hypothetical protein